MCIYAYINYKYIILYVYIIHIPFSFSVCEWHICSLFYIFFSTALFPTFLSAVAASLLSSWLFLPFLFSFLVSLSLSLSLTHTHTPPVIWTLYTLPWNSFKTSSTALILTLHGVCATLLTLFTHNTHFHYHGSEWCSFCVCFLVSLLLS